MLNLKLQVSILLDNTKIHNQHYVFCFQRTEVQVVYHLRLHVAVNDIPQRFVESGLVNLVYFIRNKKGEMRVLQ